MKRGFGVISIFVLILTMCWAATPARAQTGNSGTIEGTVTDPVGAVIPGATVEILNPVSRYAQTAVTDAAGTFRFRNIPFNPYHLVVKAANFASYTQDVDVRSGVPVTVAITLKVGTATTTVTVEETGGDLVENESTFHTDVDRKLFDRLPLESQSSSVSALITQTTPGVAADSNGLFHGLGDHAENSFSVDGQPITDQQSKVFSNQIPADSIQSLEVVSGAPPAEFGGKTSLLIKVTTRSGLGVDHPTGSITTSYGSFGTATTDFNLAYGGKNWGNYVGLSGLNTGRFLDPPEFTVFHDRGNEENIFDRVDFQISQKDSIHVNFGYSRSWFQTPNSFDQQFHSCISAAGYACAAGTNTIANNATGAPLGPADQRSQIGTFNIAPTWTHLIGTTAVFTLGTFVRRDHYNYYPSASPLNDLAPDLQVETATQDRTLTNAGIRSDVTYVKGIHNLKAGITYEQTFLNENDGFGIVDPTFNNPASPTFQPFLACYDLTRPVPGAAAAAAAAALGIPCNAAQSTLTLFHGHTDVKELALYVQDTITKGNWSFNLGIRGDLYNGLAISRQAEPRLGIAYNIKKTNTVLRISYARTLESPFNENLVIASSGCNSPVLAAIVPPPGVPCSTGPITPGFRNEFHAGLQQAFGRYLVVDAEYIWKYTHNGYDFGIVGATPITFPIEWQRSKIPGYAIRANVPNFHGFSALVVMSGVAARFFLPQVAGLPIIGPGTSVFRIDHDEHFNESSYLQYQPWKRGPWLGFNWRYDSGLVSGAVPCLAATATCSFATSPLDAPGLGVATIPGTTTPLPSGDVLLVNAITGGLLTADQEFQSGLTCDGKPAVASPFSAPLNICDAKGLGSKYVQIPAPFTENDDHNPQRIQPRSLFDASIGHDNLFRGDRYKWSLRFTVINLTNKQALYNFLSTFSGTHYVTPRTETMELGFHF